MERASTSPHSYLKTIKRGEAVPDKPETNASQRSPEANKRRFVRQMRTNRVKRRQTRKKYVACDTDTDKDNNP